MRPLIEKVMMSGAAELPVESIPLTEIVDDVERELIEQALRWTGGNRTRAGAVLCLTRQTLNYKIKRLNIRVEN